MLSNHKHDVWFALDGLKGIHEIYRQGTDFDKTMANAEAFINAGGHATWQFIPWKHNEHQLKECIKLSQQKGFKKFKLVNAVRDKQTKPFRHWQTGEVVVLEHWSQAAKKNLYLQSSRTIDYTMCMHLNQSSVYLNATGELSPCCFLNLTRASSTLDLIGDIKTELASKPSTTCIHFCGQVKSNDSHS